MCGYLVMYYSNFLKFELYIKYIIKLFTFKHIWVYTYIMEIDEICNCGLLRILALDLTAIYNKALSNSGINITQFALLKKISFLKETNISALNTLLHQDRSTLGRNIRVIKKLQLIKTSAGKDKRELKIEITDLGKEKLENAYLDWQKINKKISILLGDVKQNQLIEITKDISNIDNTKIFS